MSRSLCLILTILTLIHTTTVEAFFRLACSISQESRIDPIVSPANVSGHLHKFAGGINVNAISDGKSLQTSTCSTCQVQDDHSAYWTPSMFYQHPDGTFESVPNDGMTVYYVGRGGTAANTKSFSAGFRMVSGDASIRHYDNKSLTYNDARPIADRISFRCLKETDSDGSYPHLNDDTDCVNGLRAQINFKSCWNGQDLHRSDNSHVAYTSGIDHGDCPPSHPVPIPGLFYEVLYWVNDINQQPGGQFVLANGDPTGYSYHADFMNGWNQDVLDDAVANCLYTDDGGVVDACSALVPSNDVNFARICPQAPDVVDEPVRGNLTVLPGCNPINRDETVAALPTCVVGGTAVIEASFSTVSMSAAMTGSSVAI